MTTPNNGAKAYYCQEHDKLGCMICLTTNNGGLSLEQELLRQKIDAIFLEEYNALHDNFFHSEFEASKAASIKVMELLLKERRKAELDGRIAENKWSIKRPHGGQAASNELKERRKQLNEERKAIDV